MRRRIATLLMLFLFFGNAASAEWVPFWQSGEESAIDSGLERVHSISVETQGFSFLDESVNALIKSMLKHSTFEYTTRKAEALGFMRWDWLLQKVSVLDFSVMAHDRLYFEQSNLFGGQTLVFDGQEFSNFVSQLSILSGGLISNNPAFLFDLKRLPLIDIALLDTMQETLKTMEKWKTGSVEVLERTRPSVALPGLFGTKAIVYQIDREDIISLLGELFEAPQSDGAPLDGNESTLAALPENDILRMLWDIVTDPAQTLSGLLPEDMPPVEFREIYCYDQSVSKQLEIHVGADWLYIEWANDMDSTALSFQFGDTKASALFTFEEGAPVVGRKSQSVTKRAILEIHFQTGDIEATAYRTGIQTFENVGAKETVATQNKWIVESEQLFGSGETLAVLIASNDVAAGEGLKYKRTRETDVSVTGLQFDGTPLITAQETITFRNPTDAYAEADALRPGLIEREELEAFFEDLRNDALQVFFTILGRVPSENAQFWLELFQATPQV